MLNITLQPGDLQGVIDPFNFSSAQLQSSPIKNVTHRSPGPGGPFSAFLLPGHAWYSPGNAFRLVLQASDGNLVLQTINDLEVTFELPLLGGAGPAINPNTPNLWVPVWSPFIQNRGVTEVDFQIDGNLVAYARTNAVWNSGTSGNENATLIVQDDGNLIIRRAGPVAIWATNTSVLESKGHNT
jgi:hypothetical protein